MEMYIFEAWEMSFLLSISKSKYLIWKKSF